MIFQLVFTKPDLSVSFVDYADPEFNAYRQRYIEIPKDELISTPEDGLTRIVTTTITNENFQRLRELNDECAVVREAYKARAAAKGITFTYTVIEP